MLAVVDLWALASTRRLVRYPFTSYSQAALSLHRRPAALDVIDRSGVSPFTGAEVCAKRLHSHKRSDLGEGRVVGTGGCRVDPASASGARLICEPQVDDVCADVVDLMR